MPAYTTSGQPVPDERALELPGYPGGTDIVGNRVNAQFQLDGFGEALLLFAAAARHDRLERETYQAVTAAVSAIEASWQEPDAGLWELDTQRWAHSRLICAAGLRAMAAHGAAATDAAACRGLADAILADTAADCVHCSGRWQRSAGDPRVDAALLPTVRGALPAADPRSQATFAAVRDELTEEGYVYRFRQDRRPLGEAEEYDIGQRQLRGNLPQAFVHALMLEGSGRLAAPWPQP